jgi:hypothetical protein
MAFLGRRCAEAAALVRSQAEPAGLRRALAAAAAAAAEGRLAMAKLAATPGEIVEDWARPQGS